MRPTDLTPEVQRKICEALRAGNTRRAAYGYVGISESTFYNWLKRGKEPRLTKRGEVFKDDLPFVAFVESVTRAEDECEVWHVANIKRQADGDWRASVEWLKRRRRDDWSDKQSVDVTSGGEKMNTISVVIRHASES